MSKQCWPWRNCTLARLRDGEAVEAAIWFHDAVYDSRKADNEAKSAKLAVRLLADAAGADRLEVIAATIRASANHRVPDAMQGAAATDCALFLDMDLSLFGSPVAEFDEQPQERRAAYARRESQRAPDR